MKTRTWVLGLAVPVLFGLAGCGDDQGTGVASAGGVAAEKASASPSRSLSPEDAQLKFAQCMRQNGIDVPDPKSGSNFRLDLRGSIDRQKLETAMEKCRSYLEATGKMPDPDDPEVRDRLLKFARCARGHGIDIPDPGEDGLKGVLGRVTMQELEKARELCGQHLPGRNP